MEDAVDFDIPVRPRRLRRSEGIRAMVRETRVELDDLIMPLFVKEEGVVEEIASMPGQVRFPLSDLATHCGELLETGLRAVALFPVLDKSLKSPCGEEALNPEGLILRAVRAVKAAFPEMVILTDVALDPYTTHGHDGVLTAEEDDVDNDRTLPVLAKMAVLQAEAGVDFVAPSDMMDGRVGVIREALDAAGQTGVGIVSYAAKFASAYYGPFRDAVGSAKAAGTRSLGKKTYQLDPANRREARREVNLDEAEGADVIMVKPAGAYLDIIRDVRERTTLPLAAYQVSGEYAQIHAAARAGWLDLKAVRDESLVAIKRAGADLILTYFARELAFERAGRRFESLDGLAEYGPGGGI